MLNTLKLLGVTMAMTLVASFIVFAPPKAEAANAAELNAQADQALDNFKNHVKGSSSVLEKAKGVLILPRTYKAGIGIGGEYGEGVLREGGKNVAFYNMVEGSYGFQLGAQRKSILMFFMADEALEKFKNSSGWKAGADASVAVINVGAEGSIDTKTLNQPIVAFVVDQKGLMYDLSLNGAKFTRISKN